MGYDLLPKPTPVRVPVISLLKPSLFQALQEKMEKSNVVKNKGVMGKMPNFYRPTSRKPKPVVRRRQNRSKRLRPIMRVSLTQIRKKAIKREFKKRQNVANLNPFKLEADGTAQGYVKPEPGPERAPRPVLFSSNPYSPNAIQPQSPTHQQPQSEVPGGMTMDMACPVKLEKPDQMKSFESITGSAASIVLRECTRMLSSIQEGQEARVIGIVKQEPLSG